MNVVGDDSLIFGWQENGGQKRVYDMRTCDFKIDI